MSRKNKQRKLLLTLEQQLEAMPARPGYPDIAEPWMGDHVPLTIKAQIEWDRRRRELREAIRRRDAKRLRDAGRDVSGNFDVNPYASRGHTVEVAPKELRASATSENFPKRIVTQRVIDRYRAHGHISSEEWAAANRLWEMWMESGAEFRVSAGYDPIFVQSSQNTDVIVAKRVDAAGVLNGIWADLPWRSKGCVRAVVIEDISASDWARRRGYSDRQSKTHGMDRLRLGLQGLVEIFELDKAHRT